jgi:hypothetical protein
MASRSRGFTAVAALSLRGAGALGELMERSELSPIAATNRTAATGTIRLAADPG